MNKPLNFDVALIQLSFHTSVFTYVKLTKMASIQMLQHFIALRICTKVPLLLIYLRKETGRTLLTTGVLPCLVL